jgi:hypothetical protein
LLSLSAYSALESARRYQSTDPPERKLPYVSLMSFERAPLLPNKAAA